MTLSPSHRLLVVLGIISVATLSGCRLSGAATKKNPFPLGDLPVTETSAEWQRVRVTEVSGSPLDIRTETEVTRALAMRLVSRLGHDPGRPVTLRVENVRAVKGRGVHPILGIGADFVLEGNGAALRLTLEHSVNGIVDPTTFDTIVTRLMDDLVEVLLGHPEAVAYVEGDATALPDDSALLSAQETPVGPILPTEPSAFASGSEITSTGRVIWGNRETDSQVGVSGMFSDTYQGVFMRAVSQSGPMGFGVGPRTDIRLGFLTVDPGGIADRQNFFLFGANGGLEIGYRNFRTDPLGYVDHPFLTFLVVPQIGADFIINPDFQVVTINGGASIEADVNFHRYFGAQAAMLLGASGGVISFEGLGGTRFTETIDPVFLWKPAFDVYLQLPTGRVMLGAALDQLQSAAQGGGTDTERPIIISLSFRSKFGRGVAFKQSGVEVAGYSVRDEVDVLSSPVSAFGMASTKRREGTLHGAVAPSQAKQRFVVDADGAVVPWQDGLGETEDK